MYAQDTPMQNTVKSLLDHYLGDYYMAKMQPGNPLKSIYVTLYEQNPEEFDFTIEENEEIS